MRMNEYFEQTGLVSEETLTTTAGRTVGGAIKGVVDKVKGFFTGISNRNQVANFLTAIYGQEYQKLGVDKMAYENLFMNLSKQMQVGVDAISMALKNSGISLADIKPYALSKQDKGTLYKLSNQINLTKAQAQVAKDQKQQKATQDKAQNQETSMGHPDLTPEQQAAAKADKQHEQKINQALTLVYPQINKVAKKTITQLTKDLSVVKSQSEVQAVLKKYLASNGKRQPTGTAFVPGTTGATTAQTAPATQPNPTNIA